MPSPVPPAKSSLPGPSPVRVLAVHGADYDPNLPPALKDEWWGLWQSGLEEAAKWSLGGRPLHVERFEYASASRLWSEVNVR